MKKKHLSIHSAIEKQRTLLEQSEKEISFREFGAGNNGGLTRRVKDIAKGSLSTPAQSAFLAALIKYIQPTHVLEIGTSFGISTAYIASASPKSSVLTLEGNQSVSELAAELFVKLGLTNIVSIHGAFDSTLPVALNLLPNLDFVFFDGNHTYEATLHYFEQCAALTNNESVFVFHDIYWSPGMKRAWDEIRANPLVTLSMDLYCLGIVFFRTNQPKQHFVLKF